MPHHLAGAGSPMNAVIIVVMKGGIISRLHYSQGDGRTKVFCTHARPAQRPLSSRPSLSPCTPETMNYARGIKQSVCTNISPSGGWVGEISAKLLGFSQGPLSRSCVRLAWAFYDKVGRIRSTESFSKLRTLSVSRFLMEKWEKFCLINEHNGDAHTCNISMLFI